MGRGRVAKRDVRGPLQRAYDNERAANDQAALDVLTPEQRASGLYASGFDEKGKAQTGGRRYFRLAHIDRLHRNGKLTYEQHQAGAHYRNLWDMGRYDAPKTMNLDPLRGSNIVQFSLPTKAQEARDLWRLARREIQSRDVGFADRLLLHDQWPPQSTKQRDRCMKTLRNVLDTLAVHFRFV